MTFFLCGLAFFGGGLAGWKLKPTVYVQQAPTTLHIHEAHGVWAIPYDVKTATIMSGWEKIPDA